MDPAAERPQIICDTLNRLTSVNYGDGQTQGYSFDAMGNRIQKTDSATGTETYSTDAANRLLSVSSSNSNPNNGAYTNDANGNTLTGGGRVNTWDSQNRLVKVVKAGVTSEFVYGCDGLRRRSVVTNAAGESTKTDYAYDGTMMVAETVRHYTGGAQVGQTENVSYLQGPNGPLYRKSSLQADPKWYVYDGLGSVVGEVDVLGNLSATKVHDVYGLTRNVTGSPTSRQGFVGGLGHVSDDETGLVYMRARYYDPSVGRFESQDPAGDGVNWFGYCGNDPVNNVDSTGKMTTPEWFQWIQYWQDIEVGVGGRARDPGNLISGAPSLAKVVQAAGGSIAELMKIDSEFEGEAMNMINVSSTTAAYAASKQSLVDAIGRALGYARTYAAGSEAISEAEVATDTLITMI